MYEGIQNEDMSSGVNDGPYNTGTLPKSNRRSDRNRERSAANQQMANRSAYHRHVQQHSNNLVLIYILSILYKFDLTNNAILIVSLHI